jgi:glycosyltransferase involved in cell wall biosynthesis
MIVVIFTHSFPFDFAAEQTFIGNEILHLKEKFERVLLVPKVTKGKRLPLPDCVEVDESYAEFFKTSSRLDRLMEYAAKSRIVNRELEKNKMLLLSPSKVLKLFLFSGRAQLTSEWTSRLIKSKQIDPADCILYSYWLDQTATGLAMVKQEIPTIKVISRAHGYDLYEEYYYPYYWPYRYETLGLLDRLFFASQAGRDYCMERYPEFKSKYETARLGINDPGFVTRQSNDNVFRIISCSTIVSVKRLDLLLDGLAALARLRPGMSFEWNHFGDGEGRKLLESRMRQNFPANIEGRIWGYVPNEDIIRYYRDHPCDVFVNVSETEGGVPVAIQEAVSCGVPVIATTIGGNPEIVTKKNGILLDPDPKPEEIARAVLKISDNPLLAAEMKQESRRIWESGYAANVNFGAFAERLKSIRNN